MEQHIDRTEGDEGVYCYWKPFEAHAVERLLAEHRDCVFDFGGGHSVFEEAVLFDHVQQALSPFRNVVLLLPSPDWTSRFAFSAHESTIPVPPTSIFILFSSSIILTTNWPKLSCIQKKTPEQTRDDILTDTAAPRQ